MDGTIQDLEAKKKLNKMSTESNNKDILSFKQTKNDEMIAV